MVSLRRCWCCHVPWEHVGAANGTPSHSESRRGVAATAQALSYCWLDDRYRLSSPPDARDAQSSEERADRMALVADEGCALCRLRQCDRPGSRSDQTIELVLYLGDPSHRCGTSSAYVQLYKMVQPRPLLYR